MALSALDDKSRIPKTRDLEAVLGRAFSHWTNLKAHFADEYAPLTEKWSFSGKQYGWSEGIKQKKRTIVYLIPCKRYFLAAFVLGKKAIEAARESRLPDHVLVLIDGARKYPEGWAVRLEVRNKRDLASVKKLAAIKMAN